MRLRCILSLPCARHAEGPENGMKMRKDMTATSENAQKAGYHGIWCVASIWGAEISRILKFEVFCLGSMEGFPVNKKTKQNKTPPGSVRDSLSKN